MSIERRVEKPFHHDYPVSETTEPKSLLELHLERRRSQLELAKKVDQLEKKEKMLKKEDESLEGELRDVLQSKEIHDARMELSSYSEWESGLTIVQHVANGLSFLCPPLALLGGFAQIGSGVVKKVEESRREELYNSEDSSSKRLIRESKRILGPSLMDIDELLAEQGIFIIHTEDPQIKRLKTEFGFMTLNK